MAVNLSPYGGVGAQFLDNAGNVLTGGKIFTYAGGTTTPQATYTSSNGATPHSNPIILDAAGRVPGGEIWLTDGLVYKFILRDANDVLIATYDGITGINSNFVAFTNQQEIQTATAGQTVFNLTTISYQPGTNSLSVFVDGVNQYGPGAQYAYLETDSDTVTFVNGLHVGAEVKFTTSQLNTSGSTNDAFQVSYTPPFTNSVATNVGLKLAQTVSVKDFGAVGDGVTDDTAAIQAALDSGAKKIYVPIGTYKITDTLYVPAGGYFTGESMRSSIIDGQTLTVPMFADSVSNVLRECVFSDLKLVGNTASASNDLFYITRGTRESKFEKLWFFSCGGTAFNVLGDITAGQGGSYYNVFDQCIFGDYTDFSTGSDTSTIQGDGISAYGSCNAWTIRDCIFWRIKGHGVKLEGTSNWPLSMWQFINVQPEGCGFYSTTAKAGIYCGDYTRSINVLGGFFEGNVSNQATSPWLGAGIWVNAANFGQINVRDALFASNGYHIRIQDGHSCVIEGNSFSWNGTVPPSGNKQAYITIEANNTAGGVLGRFFIGQNAILTPSYPYVVSAVTNLVGVPALATTSNENGAVAGVFTPRLFGGATEISLSTALGSYEREGNSVVVKIVMTVSNLNGATGNLIIYGSDGTSGAFPSNAVPMNAVNSASLPAASESLKVSNITYPAGFTEGLAAMNQTGANAILLRRQGSGQAQAAMNATELTVGSVFSFTLRYFVA